MTTSWKSLATLGIGVLFGLSIEAPNASAQGFSFGYAGPGGAFGVGVGGYGYVPGGYVPGGYYGGYYGYPPIVRAPLVVAPVAPPLVVRRPYYGPGVWVGPRPYIVGRPYGPYGYYRYRRW